MKCHPEGVLWEQLPASTAYRVTGQNESPESVEMTFVSSPSSVEKWRGNTEPRLTELSCLCKGIPCKEALAYQILTKITFCPAVFHVKLNHATFQSNTVSVDYQNNLMLFFPYFSSPVSFTLSTL